MLLDPRLQHIVARQRYPLLFATISGAHLYGFPSPDSDFDLRGAHILPLRNVLGLEVADETLEDAFVEPGRSGEPPMEMDLVTHDIRKFFGLVLKKNGYVLEQIHSPWIVHTTPVHAALREIARHCVTRHHSHHYFGFADTQWKLFLKENPRRVKPLLYVYRVLLTGIHLMHSGEIEANVLRLNELLPQPGLPDLVARKLAGPEQATLAEADVDFHRARYEHLRGQLQTAFESSRLPEVVDERTRRSLDELLIQTRLSSEATPAVPPLPPGPASVS